MKKYGFVCLIALVVVGADQITKALIQAEFRLWEQVPIIPHFFSLTYIRNPGAAFGLLAQAPEAFRVPFFTIVPLLALGMLGYLIRQTAFHQKWNLVALSLILGGALGNLIDRFTAGSVVDFLLFYWDRYHFPAFNVADSSICIGVTLLVWELYREEYRARRKGKV